MQLNLLGAALRWGAPRFWKALKPLFVLTFNKHVPERFPSWEPVIPPGWLAAALGWALEQDRSARPDCPPACIGWGSCMQAPGCVDAESPEKPSLSQELHSWPLL